MILSKIGKIESNVNDIVLGVPQGSILGPLFFLIFINDLPFFIKKLNCKLFADDTTLYHNDSNLEHLLTDFNIYVKPLFEWCKRNRIDINWEKTFCMFITDKRIKLPPYIEISGIKIVAVENFKLLGVNIDKKLNFRKHIADLCLTINYYYYYLFLLLHQTWR